MSSHIPASATFSYPSSITNLSTINMTRSHKYNDRVHNAHGAQAEPLDDEVYLPKYFGKNGFPDTDPNKTKKNGSGKGNWGGIGEEIIDQQFNLTKARRRSNSSSLTHADVFKTKFDMNEPEPVFEEDLHGPLREDDEDTTLSEGSVDSKSV